MNSLSKKDLNKPPRKTQLKAFLIVWAFCFLHLLLLILYVWGGSQLGWPLIVQLVGVAVALFIVWLWRPTLGCAPADAKPISPEKKPEIFALIREICVALGTQMPAVVMTPNFTAGYAKLGLGRNPTLLLGHPLISVLDRKELVTILGHELAHAIDGAKTRSLFIRTAQQAIERLSVACHNVANGLHLMIVCRPIAKMFFWAAAFWQRVYARLDACVSADYRNAEFAADYYALTVAGDTDATSLFQKLASGMLRQVQIAYEQAHSAEKTVSIRRALNSLSERQRQDIWARVSAVEVAPNSRHPNIVQRITYLEQFQNVQPKIVVDEARFGRIQIELNQWTHDASEPK